MSTPALSNVRRTRTGSVLGTDTIHRKRARGRSGAPCITVGGVRERSEREGEGCKKQLAHYIYPAISAFSAPGPDLEHPLATPIELRKNFEYVWLKFVALALDIQKILPRHPGQVAQIRIARSAIPVLPNPLLSRCAIHYLRTPTPISTACPLVGARMNVLPPSSTFPANRVSSVSVPSAATE